ncbi:bifunctional acetaldehyde-CoA/alcohol dehydrogenase [Sansalvadorimonas verongulae]|uniref:bifunctional acetaldehyde-CoA/alcohol dehydrogenase n=1 Tax=Sansalvadorimonas verongulae TaxID=2172824 RepID=UPI0012BCE985|nr:bifunctional acetaldehyde-CoA/alcohol dehydrogenase [Sansalvadorimonas verongulae]MTI12302.1 bifunctional acetaldehyde-CoA/alcohol dehydrogenase [Sansalvadorimonas verongulae]
MTTDDNRQLEQIIESVQDAQQQYSTFSQEQVDSIFRNAALAAADARVSLAKQAASETGMGIIEDKVIKNHFASEYIYNKYRDDKTCGILEEDPTFGIIKVAEPIGVIAGIVPTTNPTSTAIFKALLALKTRNGIIFSPHPRAKNSTCTAARIVLEAAIEAGAPANIIGWIDQPSVDLSSQLMRHPAISLILATGGPGMVRAAYSSGTPAIGVGAGNTPVVIDESADIKQAVSSILMSKTFDNGVVCASEQSVIVVDSVYKQVRDRFLNHGGLVMKKADANKVAKVLLKDGALNAAIVGQPAVKIADLAGIKVPQDTKVLIAEVSDTTEKEPFAHEKLSPTLALYKAKDFTEATKRAAELVALGGIGHTSVLYTDQDRQTKRLEEYGQAMKTARILVNMPASQGAIGDLYNFKLAPSLTLGCGSWGGNSISENVGVKHLINIKTVAMKRENMLWHKLPESVYFNRGCLPVALEDLHGCKRAAIITDAFLASSGMASQVTGVLRQHGIAVRVFSGVEADPTLAIVAEGTAMMNEFQPDVIVAFGGGSPMDAAKIMWVMYEHPDVRFEELALRFMDIRKRIYHFPRMGDKARFVAIPTTSGTGSEVTPFAVVTDEKTGVKYPLADYELTPDIAIVDADLVMNMPRTLTSWGGVDALTHALEAYVSVMATPYTDGHCLQSITMIFEWLRPACQEGSCNPKAREQMHNAATIAGMGFANAFLGICHSMAHKIGSEFHLAHGLANALLISYVIRYNATDNPTKQAAFPQYDRPVAKCRYAAVADHLKLEGKDNEAKVISLIKAVEALKHDVGIPPSLQEAGVPEDMFLSNLDSLSEAAFDDQCTSTNPRYPLITEIKEILRRAYYGEDPTKAI